MTEKGKQQLYNLVVSTMLLGGVLYLPFVFWGMLAMYKAMCIKIVVGIALTNIIVRAGRLLGLLNEGPVGWTGSISEFNDRTALVQLGAFFSLMYYMNIYVPYHNRCVVEGQVSIEGDRFAGGYVEITRVIYGHPADRAALVGSNISEWSLFDGGTYDGSCRVDAIISRAGLSLSEPDPTTGLSGLIEFLPGHSVYLVCEPPFLAVYGNYDPYYCTFVCVSR